MSKFIGRKHELGELNRYLKKKSSSLLVVKGRRRIGKSRLIEEFGKNLNYYSFYGIPPSNTITAQQQRDEFAKQLGRVIDIPGIKADDWGDLFYILANHTSKGKTLILLDEISWMGSKDPTFLGKLKNAWDMYFKKNDDLILVLCGSISSWIDKNILTSTGFMGRVSFVLTLKELPLSDCSQFWKGVGAQVSAYDKFKVLSVTGGVPRYLEEIDPQQNSEYNIKNLCFKEGSILSTEFEQIFSDIFSKRSQIYREIITLVACPWLEQGSPSR